MQINQEITPAEAAAAIFALKAQLASLHDARLINSGKNRDAIIAEIKVHESALEKMKWLVSP